MKTSAHARYGNKAVRMLINKLFQGNLHDILTGYRVFSKRFVKNFPILSTGFELETEITSTPWTTAIPSWKCPPTTWTVRKGPFQAFHSVGRVKVIKTIFSVLMNHRPRSSLHHQRHPAHPRHPGAFRRFWTISGMSTSSIFPCRPVHGAVHRVALALTIAFISPRPALPSGTTMSFPSCTGTNAILSMKTRLLPGALLALLPPLTAMVAAFLPRPSSGRCWRHGHHGLHHLPYATQPMENVHNHFTVDAISQYLPYNYSVAESVRQDGYMGWNPYAHNGTPLRRTPCCARDWHHALLFLPFWTAWDTGIILQFLIAGLGMIVLLRNRKVPVPYCLLGAAGYGFTPIRHVDLPPVGAGTMCWAPGYSGR
ncbi:MAG: hypothetical protein ACLRPT_02490 [Akkermansia muciniphila]